MNDHKLFHKLSIDKWFHITGEALRYEEIPTLQVPEYAVAMGNNHKPGFKLWTPNTLSKQGAIMVLVEEYSARHLKHIHKFGVECPKTSENELAINGQNGNTM